MRIRKYKLYFPILFSNYGTLDQPFILCMPRLLIHKVEITGRIVVHIKICLRPQIKVGVEGGIAIWYLGHCYRLNACVLPESIC